MKKGKLIAILLPIAFVTTCVALSDDDYESSTGTADSKESSTSTEISSKSKWKYSETVDEMTDKITYAATIQSENYVEFEFPYEDSYMHLVIRDSPQFGKDIYIKVTSGQFNSGFETTKIKVRFDDGEAFSVLCNTPTDYSTDVLFLRNYEKLIQHLKTSSTLKISAEFFNEGYRTFSFNIANLNWEH